MCVELKGTQVTPTNKINDLIFEPCSPRVCPATTPFPHTGSSGGPGDRFFDWIRTDRGPDCFTILTLAWP